MVLIKISPTRSSQPVVQSVAVDMSYRSVKFNQTKVTLPTMQTEAAERAERSVPVPNPPPPGEIPAPPPPRCSSPRFLLSPVHTCGQAHIMTCMQCEPRRTNAGATTSNAVRRGLSPAKPPTSREVPSGPRRPTASPREPPRAPTPN